MGPDAVSKCPSDKQAYAYKQAEVTFGVFPKKTTSVNDKQL